MRQVKRFGGVVSIVFAIAVLALNMGGVDMAQDIPPCVYEDGSGQAGWCYWDASAHGNRKGDGVFIYRDGELIAQR